MGVGWRKHPAYTGLSRTHRWVRAHLSGRVFGIVLGIVGWYALASVFPEELMPFPSEVVVLVWEILTEGNAIYHLKGTLWRTFWGFVGSVLLGIAMGVLVGINSYGKHFLTPYIIIGLSIPAVAWAAIGTLIFGFGLWAPVSATVLTSFPFIAVNVWKVVENLDHDLIAMSRGFDVTNRRILAGVILPSAAPALMAAFRFGLAISWRIVTIAEMFASSNGIGYKIVETYQLYKFEEAWAYAALFMIVILIIEYGVMIPLERRIFKYRRDADFTKIGR